MKSSNSIKIEAVDVKLLTDQLKDDPHINPSTLTNEDSLHKSSPIDTPSIALVNYNIQHDNISHNRREIFILSHYAHDTRG